MTFQTEPNVQITSKRVTVMGEYGPQQTIIDGGGMSPAFRVNQSYDCALQGLTLRNGYSNMSGGAIFSTGSTLRVSNCILLDNIANRGGAIYAVASQGMIESCLLVYNSATTSGGAVHLEKGAFELRNCTIVDNHAATGGGVHFSGGDHELRSNIVWNNTAQNGSQLGLVALFGRGGVPVTLNANFNDIHGGVDEIYFGSLTGITLDWGEGNLDQQPLFVSVPRPGTIQEADYHLRSDSPCIDAGDPDQLPHPNIRDIDGDPRVRNGRVDIGADEFAIDCNDNGQPDAMDIASGKSADCNTNGIPDECDVVASDWRPPVSEDCNDNGIPDECEFAPCIDCDINGDGKIDKLDRIFMNECIAEPNPDLCRTADLDGDGKVTKHDRTLLQQCFSDEGSHMQLGK